MTPCSPVLNCLKNVLTLFSNLDYFLVARTPMNPLDRATPSCRTDDGLNANHSPGLGELNEIQCTHKLASKENLLLVGKGVLVTALYSDKVLSFVPSISKIHFNVAIHVLNFLTRSRGVFPWVRLPQFFANSLGAYLSCSLEFIVSNANSNHEIRWVTLDKCAELVGLTKDALNALRVRGHLRMDIHWKKRQGRIYIDLIAFQRWVDVGA